MNRGTTVEEWPAYWAEAFARASVGQPADVVEFAALLPVTLPDYAAPLLAELRAKAAQGLVSRSWLNQLGRLPALRFEGDDASRPRYRPGMLAASLTAGGVLQPYGEDAFMLTPRWC